MISALLGLFGFSLMAAYWPGIAGAGTSPRWVVIAAAACVVLVGVRPQRFTFAHGLGLAFVAWCFLSYLWTSTPLDSVEALGQLALLAAMFVLGAAVVDLRPLYLGAVFGLAVSSGLVVFDRLELIAYPQYMRPSGLFVNGLYLAEAAAMVAAACLLLRWWWALVALAPSLVLVSPARGPLLALGVVGVIELWRLSRFWGAAAATWGALLLAGAVWYRPATILDRLNLWGDGLMSMTFLGSGWGSYYGVAPFFSALHDGAVNRVPHAHNDLLEVALTAGVPGLVLAGAFLATIIFGASNADAKWDTSRAVIVVFVVAGCFGFPFWLPATAGLFAVAAGFASRDLPALRWAADPVGACICGRPGCRVAPIVDR